MSAALLLADLEATGIKVTRRGDNLRLRVKRGVNLDPFLDQITAHKPALLTLLALQDEIVRTASAAQKMPSIASTTTDFGSAGMHSTTRRPSDAHIHDQLPTLRPEARTGQGLVPRRFLAPL